MCIPCISICIISCAISWLGGIYNEKAYVKGADEYIAGVYNVSPSLINLYDSIKALLFGGDIGFAPQLWTMKYDIVIGTVCLFMLLLGKKKGVRWILYTIFILVCVGVYKDNYMEAFGCGMIAAEICKYNVSFKVKKRLLYLGILLSLSCSACAYSIGIWWMIPLADGIFLIIAYSLWKDKCIDNWLAKMLIKFGNYSFEFYLIHFIFIVTVSAYLYCQLIDHFGNMWTYFIVFCETFLGTLVLAVLYHKYFVDILDRYIGLIYHKLY